MKQKLSFKEYIYVASMLFGMFFGAGNLICRFFPCPPAGSVVHFLPVRALTEGKG